MSEHARRSALRIAEALVAAKEGNYFRQGWASYLDRVDVEQLVLAQLNPTERQLWLRTLYLPEA